MRQTGIVSVLNLRRNFLLIRPENEERRLFCSCNEFQGLSVPAPGHRVEFEVLPDFPHHACRVRLV